MNVRYFFVTDQIKKGHVKVAFCPMQDMIADFFTKPLQGSLFVHMREKILNLPASKIASVHRSVLEERGADLIKYKKNDRKRKNDGQEIKQDSETRKNDGQENKQDSETRIRLDR